MHHRLIVLCSANRKGAQPAPALHLYRSPLFYAGRTWALRREPDRVLILSATYGVVEATQELPPYPMTMSAMADTDLEPWAESVVELMQPYLRRPPTEIILLALDRFAVPLLRRMPPTRAPLAGMTFPEALAWLRRENKREAAEGISDLV
ncbi:MAG: hypothetical protein SF053_03590 [Bacteroidia bacterium]|nr:hypothetical protein [Bacteroidia bacterium]